MEQRGRPSSYSAEIAQLICDRLATGESLLSICKDESFPTESTVRHWALEDREGFFANYSRARDLGLDCRADKVLEIPRGVTSEDVPRARLEFDAERWYLSKLAPKRYGDAQLIKHADHEGNAMHVKVTRVKGRED
jgi:hypothetical protein